MPVCRSDCTSPCPKSPLKWHVLPLNDSNCGAPRRKVCLPDVMDEFMGATQLTPKERTEM